jgi:hypothetical protein
MLAALPFLAACGESSTEPKLELSMVTGTYAMTALRFDPQGSLPDSNILPVITGGVQLNLTSARQAQLVYRDPISTLVITIQGTFDTTAGGVRIEFPSQATHRQLLLSQQMEFIFTTGAETLTFTADAPEGVSRARLIELVPSLANEQLLDPTPGFLTVTFRRS